MIPPEHVGCNLTGQRWLLQLYHVCAQGREKGKQHQKALSHFSEKQVSLEAPHTTSARQKSVTSPWVPTGLGNTYMKTMLE